MGCLLEYRTRCRALKASLRTPIHSIAHVIDGRGRALAVATALFWLLAMLPASSHATADSPGAWFLTGSLVSGRYNHTATLLPNGQVLVTGGNGAGSSAVLGFSAELYNPATGIWSPTDSMSSARAYHTATLLPNGTVLVAGGFNGSGALSSAELYDPSTGVFTPTGSMNRARLFHTATLLPSGKVLVVGGESTCCPGPALSSAELYDPHTGTWTLTGSLNTARYGHTATLLNTGKVLVVGGCCNGDGTSMSSAELYDPATGAWAPTGSMAAHRIRHTATLLPTGQVLVAGGCDLSPNCLATAAAELYDPITGVWSPTGSMSTARTAHTATLLPSGQVLVTGGTDLGGLSLSSTELYDPTSGKWSPGDTMSASRSGHSATLLATGQILIAGGCCPLASAELYLSPQVAFSSTAVDYGDQLVGARSVTQTVALTNTGSVGLVVGSVAVTGTNATDFSTTTTCTTVAVGPNGSCAIVVAFDPAASGPRGARLIITDNASDSPQFVTLSGNGSISPTVTPTSTPVPTATPRPTPRPRVLLRVSGLPGRVAGGGTLVLAIQTAAHAQVTLTVSVVQTHWTYTGKGTHRHRVRRDIVRYRVSLHGTTDKHGQIIMHLRITYKPATSEMAAVVVQAHTAQGTASQTMYVTIEPPGSLHSH